MDESLIEKQNGNFAKPVLYEVCRAGIKEAWLAGFLSALAWLVQVFGYILAGLYSSARVAENPLLYAAVMDFKLFAKCG